MAGKCSEALACFDNGLITLDGNLESSIRRRCNVSFKKIIRMISGWVYNFFSSHDYRMLKQ